MSDIKQIGLNGNVYPLKDEVARNAINVLEQEVDSLEESLNTVNSRIDYAQLEPTQTMIYDANGIKFMQGMTCDDNNTLYQYVSNEDGTGNLLRFNLLQHTYIDMIPNVPLMHGNSLAYKDGKIWAACFRETTINDTTKIASYNVSDGTSAVYNPFVSLGYSRSFGICDNNTENELLVGMYKVGGTSGYNFNNLSICKFNTATLEYSEYTIDYGNQPVGHAIPVEFERIGNRLYMLTATSNFLYIWTINDDNMTITLEKVYNMGYCDELGIAYGEMEGFTKIPSQYYGKETFVFSAFTIEDDSSKCSFKYYLINPINKIKKFTINILGSNYQMRGINVYVKATSDSLLEDGSINFPFKSLGRAIEYVSNNKLGLRYDDIYIQDSSTYVIGQLYGVKASIRWSDDNQPTFNCKVSKMRHSNIWLRGTLKANFNILDNSYSIGDSIFNATNLVFNKMISFSNSVASITDCDWNIDSNTTVQDLIQAYASDVRARIGTVTGTYSRNALTGASGSRIQINSTYANKAYAGSGSVLATSTSA